MSFDAGCARVVVRAFLSSGAPMLKYALKCFYIMLFWFRQLRDWAYYHAYYWPFVHTGLTRLQLLRLHTSKLGYAGM